MNLVWSIIISTLQGVSELFPVRGLGLAMLLPRLLRWGTDEKSDSWLALLVALHLGTASALPAVLCGYYALLARHGQEHTGGVSVLPAHATLLSARRVGVV